MNLKEGRAFLPALGRDQPVYLKIDSRASRFKGAVREGRPLLVVPRRATKQEAIRALTELGPWFVSALMKVEWQKSLLPEGHILLKGRIVPLVCRQDQASLFILSDAGLHVKAENMENAEIAALGWLYRQAERELLAGVADWSQKMSLKPKGVRVSETFSKWGSCTKRGDLSFSWRQIMAPSEIMEYLVVHELSHIRHPHHQMSFWKEVEKYCPFWKSADEWLAKSGTVLMNLYSRQSVTTLKKVRPQPPIKPGQLEPFTRLYAFKDEA